MQEEMEKKCKLVEGGLCFVVRELYHALQGERQIKLNEPGKKSPLAAALRRTAEIADGEEFWIQSQAEEDLQYLWPFLRHVAGAYNSFFWDILGKAHEKVAVPGGLLTEEEAAEILGEDLHGLDFNSRLGHLHPFDVRTPRGEGEEWRPFDATYLKKIGPTKFARYEILAYKQKQENLAKTQEMLLVNKQEA